MERRKLLVIPLLGLIIISGVAAVLAQEGLSDDSNEEGLAEAETTAQEQGTETTEDDEAERKSAFKELRTGFLEEAKTLMQNRIDLLNEDISKEQFKERFDAHIASFKEMRGQYIEDFRQEGCSAVEHHWGKDSAFRWYDASGNSEVEKNGDIPELYHNLGELKELFSGMEWDKLSQLLENMGE